MLSIRIVVVSEVIEELKFTKDAILDRMIECRDAFSEHNPSANSTNSKRIIECSYAIKSRSNL